MDPKDTEELTQYIQNGSHASEDLWLHTLRHIVVAIVWMR